MKGLALWHGWEQAIDAELERAGGKLPWTDLLDAVVSAYCDATGAKRTKNICLHALDMFPSSCLSRRDHFVRSISYSIERHHRRFRLHNDPLRLLAKYGNLGKYTNRQILLRHLCHVCSWVVKLPEADVTMAGNDISPASILTKLMRHCRQGPLTPRLQAHLQLVHARTANVLENSSLDNQDRKAWEAMRESLLRPIKKHKCSETACCVHTSSISSSTNCAQLVMSEICKLRSKFHHLGEQSGSAARQILAQARFAESKGDLELLCQVLLTSVSWLAKPILKAHQSHDNVMGIVAVDRLRAAAQTVLRKSILICLEVIAKSRDNFRNGVVDISLLCIEAAIGDMNLTMAAAGEQWLAISALLAKLSNDAPPAALQVEIHKLLDSSGVAARTEEPEAARHRLSKNGMAAALVRDAMIKIGGDCTSLDVIEKIKSDQELHGRVVNHMNTSVWKRGGGCTKPFQVWENLVTQQVRLVGEKTGAKRQRIGSGGTSQFVYRLSK